MQYLEWLSKKNLSFFKKLRSLEVDFLWVYLELRAEIEFFVTFVNGLWWGRERLLWNVLVRMVDEGARCSVLYKQD